MRKLFLLLLALAATCQLMAQEGKKSEISIGIGFSADDINFVKQILLTMQDIDHKLEVDDKKRSGFYLLYKYCLNKRWAVGTTLTYKGRKKEQTSGDDRAKYTQNYFGINLEGRYTYFYKRIFRMYALAGVGVYTCHEKLRRYGSNEIKLTNNTTNFTYQISPLCLEIGTNIGGKLEYGYGYKGIASAGFYIRF